MTDAFSLNLGADYTFGSSSHVNLANGGGNTTDRNGFQDPTFGATYRLMDPRNQPYSLDLFGHYSPDLVDARTADPTEDATAGRGGDAFDFGAALGHQTRAFTIQGIVKGEYIGRRKIDNRLIGDTTKSSGYWIPSVGVATQTRLSDRFSINAGADYNFNGNTHVIDEDTGVEHALRQGDFQTVNVALNYHFIPNTLVGSLNYHHTFFGKTDSRFPADPTMDYLIDNKSGDTVGAGLTYQFR